MSNTSMKQHNSGLMSVFITLTMLFFGLLVALFVLKMALGIFMFVAPLAGILLAGMGGFRYVKADEEGEKLGALKWVAAGLGLIILSSIF